MEEPVEIFLSDKKETQYEKPLQLLPSLGHLSLPSLQKNQLSKIQQIEKQITPPPSYQFSYSTKYEETVASQEFFPFCLALNQKYIVIAGKSQILVFDQIDFSSFFKIPFEEIVTCMDVYKDILIIGTQTGRIVLSNLLKRNILSQSTYFSYSILKVKMVGYYKLYAIDCLGGCAFMQFNVKTILQKMIVTSTDQFVIFQVQKRRNRDKIKKLWKNMLSKEQQPQITEVVEFENDFSIAYEQFSDYLNPNELCLAVFKNSELSVLTLSTSKIQIKTNQRLLQHQKIPKIGILRFGIGGFQTSNQTHMFLVVSHGTNISYIRFVKIDDFYQWHHVFTTSISCPIYYGTFLSNNLMVLLTERGIQMLAVGQTPEIISKIEFNNFNYIDFFNSEENAKINKSQVYKNILRGCWKLNFFCCLQGKRIVIGNIQNWKSYLQTYQNQNKWSEIIKYSMLIYHGKLKLLAGIPENREQRKKQMQIYFQSVVMAYICFQLNQHPQQVQQTIALSIKFMVDIQNFQCLFTSVYEALQAHKQLFFDKLQVFISAGKIKNITNQTLQEAIKYYKTKNSPETIENLLINLDLDLVDKAMVLQTCLQQQLFRSLINICVSTKDYITPMAKLSGLISLQSTLTVEQTRVGRAILSYIKNCLDGYYVDYHDDQKYLSMLEKLVTYFMLPISLKLISKTDPQNFFRLLQLFFEGRVFQLILQNSERFLIKNNAYMNLSIFQKQNCSQFEVYQKILKNIIFTEYIPLEGGKQKKELDKFILFLVLKNQFPFNDGLKLRACEFLIKTPRVFFQDDEENREVNQVDINAYLMRIFDSIFPKLDESQKYIRLQKFIVLIYETNNEELLCESLCYLYHMQQKFKKVFQMYLKMKNSILRQKIMLYLQQNLDKKQLIKQALNNLMSLLKIDEDHTINILVHKLPDYCEQVINKLSGYPKYQLKYLQSLFRTQHHLKAQLKLVHLNIVIKYQKNEVERFLKAMDYPLDQAYRICEDAGHKPAMAYLLVKKGKIKQGLNIMIDIFCELSGDIVGQLARRQAADKSQLMFRLKQMIQVCADLTMDDLQEGQLMWFTLLQKVFRHIKIQNLVKDNVPSTIKQLLGEIVQTILSSMCKYISIDFFIEKFAFTFTSLPINIFYKAYSLMNDRLMFTVKVNNLVLAVCESDHFEQSNIIKMYYSTGFASNGQCEKCQKVESEAEEPKIVFRCWHTYHLGCIPKMQCIICPKTQDSSELQTLRDNRWIIPPKKHRLKRQKLENFDRELDDIYKNFANQIQQLYTPIKVKTKVSPIQER